MMAKHSYEKARWNRREARKRTPFKGWAGWIYGSAALKSNQVDPEDVKRVQKRLSRRMHHGLGKFTRRYRKLWRRQGHTQERLHLLKLHDEAQELDPQPRRLGVMWDIW